MDSSHRPSSRFAFGRTLSDIYETSAGVLLDDAETLLMPIRGPASRPGLVRRAKAPHPSGG